MKPAVVDNGPLDQPLTALRGVGPDLARKLAGLELQRVGDLLFHLPLRYEDRRAFVPMARLQPDRDQLVRGVVEHAEQKFGRRRSLLVSVRDDSGWLRLRFFHYNRQQAESFRRGRHVRCFGTVRAGPGANRAEAAHVATATETLGLLAVVVEEPQPQPAAVVAHRDQQAASAPELLLRVFNDPAHQLVTVGLQARHRHEGTAVLVAKRQVEQQVADPLQLQAGQLARQVRPDAAQCRQRLVQGAIVHHRRLHAAGLSRAPAPRRPPRARPSATATRRSRHGPGTARRNTRP